MISERVGRSDYEGKPSVSELRVQASQLDATMIPHHSAAAKTYTLLTE
jgi:hypothetical protein